MVWRKLFGGTTESDSGKPETVDESRRAIPSHLAQAIERRSGEGDRQSPGDPVQRKLAALRRQRQAILFDIEQGELADTPDNPWTSRITLLGEAMQTVTDDLAIASRVALGPFHPVPATQIAIEAIDEGDVATVAFTVGSERFVYADDPDWAERGHQIARTELVRQSGSVDTLIPSDTPTDLRAALGEHYSDSLFVFATNLRDRSLDGEPLPESPTLTDLARPCPVCGGWMDWRGTCQTCARRNAEAMALKREEVRLLDERAREAEDRARIVEGLSLARTRLRNVEADLARLGETVE